MKRADVDINQKILERLMFLDPPMKRFPVSPPDSAAGVFLLKLSEVCYITTKADQGRDETQFMTRNKEGFYSNLGLSVIEDRLKDHPHFLRTCKFYLVNLTLITRIAVTNSRDLWFEGLDKPVSNAVTNTYLAEFEKRLMLG